MRILIAEDHELNQKLIKMILTQLKYDFEIVVNGEEAVEAISSGDFDFVLMDARMPVMDGFEATRQIRLMQEPKGSVPIVALSAEGDDTNIREEILAASMDDFLAIPLELAKLAGVLTQYQPQSL